MEVLLWRWSTVVQLSSALMIAVFFFVLSRSMRRIELKPWVHAWMINLMALVVANVFWFFRPQGEITFWILRFAYIFAKTMFVAFLLIGTSYFSSQWFIIKMQRRMIVGIIIYSTICAFVLNSIERIGVGEYALMAVAFTFEAIVLLKNSKEPLRWLCIGFILRAALAAFEGAMFADVISPKPIFPTSLLNLFLGAHSSFDTGAEWVIALGCVLAIYSRIQQELTQSNEDLMAYQEVLQSLADRDPLTSLGNRRALPGIFRSTFTTGATIFFFDLDGFKEINDHYGHAAGDECLRTFARALQESFRPDDHIVRYAGDEFVVVAPGVEPHLSFERIEQLRKRLQDISSGPSIRFSVGNSYLAANGDPDDALRAADAAMYQEKSRGRRVQAPRLEQQA